jgi:hypothetical protein
VVVLLSVLRKWHGHKHGSLHFENVLEARPRHLATPSILHLPTF